MYADPSFNPVNDADQYIAPDGTKYPYNFPKASIPTLTPVTSTARPTDPTLIVTGFTIDGTYTQVWHTRAMNSAELAAYNASLNSATAGIVTDSANSLLLRKANKQTAAGNTAAALKTLLKLQKGL